MSGENGAVLDGAVLAIDTSAAASVALVSGGQNGAPVVVAQRSQFSSKKHAEFVGPAIREVVAQPTQAQPTQPQPTQPQPVAVIVGVGPGPFTGLRAGIAAGIGYALGAGIPVYGVRSHDALAYRALTHGVTGQLVVATDARRKEVYVTTYRLGSAASPAGQPPTGSEAPQAEVASGPHVISPSALGATINHTATTRMGRGFALYAEQLGQPDFSDNEFLEPTAADLGAAALVAMHTTWAGAPNPPSAPTPAGTSAVGALLATTPLYLREPDAQPRQ